MDSRSCMNGFCGASSLSSMSIEWKKAWPLRSGGFATLCAKCGTAYEQLVFCEMFHSKETGWRECSSCGKVSQQGASLCRTTHVRKSSFICTGTLV